MPSSTTTANPTKSTLFATKSPSRDSAWSTPTGERSRSPRQASSATPETTVTKKKPISRGPSVLDENE